LKIGPQYFNSPDQLEGMINVTVTYAKQVLKYWKQVVKVS